MAGGGWDGQFVADTNAGKREFHPFLFITCLHASLYRHIHCRSLNIIVVVVLVAVPEAQLTASASILPELTTKLTTKLTTSSKSPNNVALTASTAAVTTLHHSHNFSDQCSTKPAGRRIQAIARIKIPLPFGANLCKSLWLDRSVVLH